MKSRDLSELRRRIEIGGCNVIGINQQVHMWVFNIKIGVDWYMFRPPIVAIFREMFLEGILYRTILIINQQMHYIKFHIKTLKIAPTRFDPKIILRELRCSLLKSF